MNYYQRKRLMMAHADMPEHRSALDGHVAKASSNVANAPIGSARDASSRSTQTRQNTASKEFKLQELTMLSLGPIFRSIHHWWLARAERHFLICADVEEQRAREAQLNVAYYHKRAALARSARL